MLGRTLPSLLDEACDCRDNPQAFNQRTNGSWQSLSTRAFRTAAEEVAVGLLALGLEPGDRVGLFMYDNRDFCLVDMGCLLARLPDVPIQRTEMPINIAGILQQTTARLLVVSDLALLQELAPLLEAPSQLSQLQFVVVAQTSSDGLVSWQQQVPALPEKIRVLSLAEVRNQGRAEFATRQPQLRAAISPDALATIVYTPGATGQPRGVMLTHENLSANVLATFSGVPELEAGPQTVVLSYLPLPHIFARAFIYGHLYYGHSLYFSTPRQLVKHLQEVRPTFVLSVPRFLEKVYKKLVESSRQTPGLRGFIARWGLRLAQQHELGGSSHLWRALQLKLADWLVFERWRAVFGGRLEYLVCGGAALQAEIANFFAATGIEILHGYGLTETSSVACCNRSRFNHAGTVGVPLAGVEVAIAPDGEVLMRSPYIMQGYYHDPGATRRAIDPEGWFHTGDLGEFTSDGYLKIAGYKKDLFKLSTGKYVTPRPLERQLRQSPLVVQAIVVGARQKYCSMLIVPNLDALRDRARTLELDLPTAELLVHPEVLALYRELVDAANQQLPHWSQVKRFQLIDPSVDLAIDPGAVTASPQHFPVLTIAPRTTLRELLTPIIDALYAGAGTSVAALVFVPVWPSELF